MSDHDPAAVLRSHLSGIDIYLLDQILKNRFSPGARILDAGCGGGRNISWFLNNGYEVAAVDGSPHSIANVRQLASELTPGLPLENFQVQHVEHMTFGDSSFDVVLSIAVLHFAHDDWHFNSMLQEMWRVLKPGGILFVRLGSSIGIEDRVRPLGNGRFAVPDGSERYLVNLGILDILTTTMKAQLLEPVKTVNVQNMRCMTTWVLRKL